MPTPQTPVNQSNEPAKQPLISTNPGSSLFGSSSIIVLIITSGLTLISTIVSGFMKAYWDDNLAQRTFYNNMILKALEPADPVVRLHSLQLLTKTNLIKDADIKQGVEAYTKENQKTPAKIPQVQPDVPTPTLPKPPAHSQIYLLTGNRAKMSSIDSVRIPLAAAGFTILNAKVLDNDPGRPDEAEVRYFYKEDQGQAELLANFFRRHLKRKRMASLLYHDRSVQPGYIEIWTGR
jgi:hypothetical protein